MKTKQFNEYITLDQLKPEVSKDGIFFPVSVRHENLDQYHDDARSFGYHFDDGACTVVEYDQAMGVMADDTIAIFEECEEIKKHMEKPHHSLLEIIDDDSNFCDKNNSELLIRYDSEFFYKDESGYFFATQYYCQGEPQRVTDESAEIYCSVNKEYQRQIKKYNAIMKQALENIKLLKTTL